MASWRARCGPPTYIQSTTDPPLPMPYALLTLDVSDRIATITVNRPDKLNALNDALMGELGDAVREAIGRGDVGGILLTGAGRAFVAGADIGELVSQTAVEGKARAE